MTRFAYTLHRVLGGILFLMFLFAMANYYFNFGVFGEHAKGIVLLGIGLILTYISFLAPTRADRREHRGGRKITKNG